MDYIHPKLRPYQEQTLERIRQSQSRYVIVQAPTGAGKSFFAAQLAAWGHKVLALVRTKSLQQQYVNSYDFTELFGKSNYICKEHGQTQEMWASDERTTADLCTVPDEMRGRCKMTCPYPMARYDFIESYAGTLNYSKFLTDRPVADAFGPEFLFLDEAHDLSDLTVEFAGITLNWKDKRLKRYASPITFDLPQPIARKEAERYLRDVLGALEGDKPLHPSDGGEKRVYKHWERLKERVDITLAAMELEPECWFAYADDKHLVCKPLTARYHFKRLFEKAPKIVLMSATIGKIAYFVRELGITDYEFIDVPNVIPAPLRPIEDLLVPALNFHSSYSDWMKHSQIISDRINQCPDHWTGLIHTPSKRLAWDMAERIEQMTRRPIFVPSKEWGTERAAEEWFKIKDNGTLCISWNFWEGLDAGKDAICVVGKVPFVPMIFKRDENGKLIKDHRGKNVPEGYDTNRFLFDGSSGYQRIANKMVQGLGRTRRGRTRDYGPNGLVAVADRNWLRLRNYLHQDIMEAIR